MDLKLAQFRKPQLTAGHVRRLKAMRCIFRLTKALAIFVVGPCFCCVGVWAHDFAPDRVFHEVVIPPHSADNLDSVTAGGLGAVVSAYKLWQPGVTLNVCFIGGEAEVRAFFIEAERDWELAANLKWDFGNVPSYRECDSSHPSHIRIAFQPSGNWSLVGTDAIRTDHHLGLPSLNIGDAASGAVALVDRVALYGTILHEIGHAYGLEHEHQSPNDPCATRIKWRVVYSELARPPNNWDQAKVDLNLRALTHTERLRTTPYDNKSIMHYSFPARWFDDPTCAIEPNYSLSISDKDEIARAYPKQPSDQRLYIAGLDGVAQTAVKRFDISSDDKTALQRDIDSIKESLDDKLRSEASSIVNGSGISGVFIQGSRITSSGDCSPTIVGVQGNVTTTATCEKK
jgi:hypothetical protein